VPWTVLIADELAEELATLPAEARRRLLARAGLLAEFGPELGRPHVDTLAGARHANMKELRFDAAGGVWRVAFAFDPERRAVLLAAGDKAGRGERRFYRRLIALADARLDRHLAALAADKPKRR
jgi:hypothetical protein